MWEGFRRLYLFAMTENMRAILRRWQKQLFTEQVPYTYNGSRSECRNQSNGKIIEVPNYYINHVILL